VTTSPNEPIPAAQTTTTTEPAPASNPAELEPAVAPVPLTLEALAIPEGLSLTAADGTPLPEAAEFLALVNEKGLDPESASKFLSTHHKLLETAFQSAVEAHGQQWEALQAEWQQQVRALPDFAGDKFDAGMAKIAKILDKYGSKEAREAFSLTGAGNNPHIVQMLKKIADDMSEAAAPVMGQPSPGAAKDRATRMFGSS
jgi:hypothetical protein